MLLIIRSVCVRYKRWEDLTSVLVYTTSSVVFETVERGDGHGCSTFTERFLFPPPRFKKFPDNGPCSSVVRCLEGLKQKSSSRYNRCTGKRTRIGGSDIVPTGASSTVLPRTKGVHKSPPLHPTSSTPLILPMPSKILGVVGDLVFRRHGQSVSLPTSLSVC